MNFEDLNNLELAEEAPQGQSSAWLVSLTDLISLILTFFVMIFATKDLPQEKLDQIQDSFVKYINGEELEKIDIKIKTSDEGIKTIKKSSNVEYIATAIKNSLLGNDYLDINVVTQENQVALEFTREFESLPDLADKMNNSLFTISKTLNSISNQVEVVADGNSIKKSLELTEFVADKLEEQGYEYKVLRTIINKDFETEETVEKNKNNTKIQIIVKNYESVF
jgi:flagellar motor protein MotB